MVKVIKRGMDSKAFIARFEAERPEVDDLPPDWRRTREKGVEVFVGGP